MCDDSQLLQMSRHTKIAYIGIDGLFQDLWSFFFLVIYSKIVFDQERRLALNFKTIIAGI